MAIKKKMKNTGCLRVGFEAACINDKGKNDKMEEKTYKVKRIDGEYAYLEPQDESSDELFIAMALLPLGVDVGSLLEFKNFEFTLIS